MRELTTQLKLKQFMSAIGARAQHEAAVYFTGGVSAVLMGWRDSTVDIDLRFDPEFDEFFRALSPLKEELHINVELASPPDFIPVLPGWKERSIFIGKEGHASFYHYDFYSQALSKIERQHAQDVVDVKAMIENGLVERNQLWGLYQAIEPELYRYPAIDPKSFSAAVEEIVRPH